MVALNSVNSVSGWCPGAGQAYLGSRTGVLEEVHFAEVISQSDHLPVVGPDQSVDVCTIGTLRPHSWKTQTHTHWWFCSTITVKIWSLSSEPVCTFHMCAYTKSCQKHTTRGQTNTVRETSYTSPCTLTCSIHSLSYFPSLTGLYKNICMHI